MGHVDDDLHKGLMSKCMNWLMNDRSVILICDTREKAMFIAQELTEKFPKSFEMNSSKQVLKFDNVVLKPIGVSELMNIKGFQHRGKRPMHIIDRQLTSSKRFDLTMNDFPDFLQRHLKNNQH